MRAIAAVATPPGRGGVSIIRVSGDDASRILETIFAPASPQFKGFAPWRLTRGYIHNAKGETLDEVLCVFMPGPKTFTGEDVAEIHCHGNPAITTSIIEAAIEAGARGATRGEFTKRAFLNGRLDLTQAEAVAELIAAPTTQAARLGLNRLKGALGQKIARMRDDLDDLRALACVGLDFPDDEIPPLPAEEFAAKAGAIRDDLIRLTKGARRAELMQHGAKVLLAGSPNVGKSSLLNALGGQERALVTPTPGTTRDYLDVNLNLDGLAVTLIDTAGLRAKSAALDQVEKMGIARGRDLQKEADLILLVIDCAAQTAEAASAAAEVVRANKDKPVIVVFNKTDLAPPPPLPRELVNLPSARVSALTGAGLEDLVALIRATLPADENDPDLEELAPNRRQAAAFDRAANELDLLLADISRDASYDCLVARLDETAALLEEIIGVAPADALLDRIFSQFCIGK